MPNYVKPPVVSTGQILGRSYLDVLRDNDEYFMALADGWRPVIRGAVRSWIGGETTQTIFDGYHLLTSDAKTLHYNFTIAGGDGAPNHATATLYYYALDGIAKTTIATQSGNGTSNSTADLEAIPEGLHRVECLMTRVDYLASPNATCTFLAPYTTYTGIESYTAPTAFVDTNVSAAADFNVLRTNDLYFYACRPRQPAFSGTVAGFIGDEHDRTIWNGWIKYHSTHDRFHYKIGLSSTASGAHVKVIFDSDGAAEEVVDVVAAGTAESYFDLEETYADGTWYHVTVSVHRTDHLYGTGVSVYYLYMAPTTAQQMSGFTKMDDFTVGQWVYGSTAGQLTRLDYLADNDVVIRPALTWDASHGRIDYTVSKAEDIRLGATDKGYMFLKRRYDTLYYKGEGEIKWGTDHSQALTATDDDNPYLMLDLTGVADLAYGQIYYISKDKCYFAMEG